MCGIVGIVHTDQRCPVAPAVLETMCEAIRHRGPDDQGTHVVGPVGLGMRRLSIIDLEGGHQPIYNEDRTKIMVINGEIYNYQSLQRELKARGHRFRSRGDSETVLHLFEDEEATCVHRLRGMFAFAVWDTEARRLTLACDRFGIKPLYVATHPWGLAFASELKALVSVGLHSDTLDWNALDQYFHLGYIPAPSTPFQHVRKLEGGHLLTWTPEHGPRTTQYWDVPTTPSAAGPHPEADVLSWIDESVNAHMASDVPVAAFLSGGIDSSAIVASMAQAGAKPHAFTVRYRGTGSELTDETPLAQALVARYGAQMTIVDVEPDVRDLLEPLVSALDEPHADESALPTWLISERVAADYKVALVGTGGDELFAGYQRHIGLIVAAAWARLPRGPRQVLSGIVNRFPEPRGGTLATHRLKRFLRLQSRTLPDQYLELLDKFPVGGLTGLYNRELAETMEHNSAIALFRDHYAAGHRPQGVRGALYLDYKTYLPGDLLHLSDRLSMAHSLEIRVPFVDHRLVEHAFPLPDRLKIGPWRQKKRLLRRALRTRLPPQHFAAPKRGFVGPTAVWLRNELRDTMVDELSAARMSRLGYFDPVAVGQLLNEHLTHQHNHESVLWALLCFSTWHRLTCERQTADLYDPQSAGSR